MRTHLGLPTLALFLLAPACAHAADYVVASSGSDSNAGTAAKPWKTLQHAIESVKAGDTVTALDGTYAGFVCDGVSGTAGSPIVVRAQNKWKARITSASPAEPQDFVQLASCSYVVVDGFEVTGAPRSGIAVLGNTDTGSDARGVVIRNNWSHDVGGGVAKGRHDGVFSGFALDLTIEDNLIDHAGEHGIYVSNAADNPTIRRNVVHDTGANCIQINADLSTGGDGIITGWLIESNIAHGCNGSYAINLDGASNGILRNNIVYAAAKGGVALFQGDGATASSNNLIVNNTIYIPGGSRSALQVADGANGNVVFNNVLYGKPGLEIQTVSGLVHDYNLISDFDGGSASAHESSPPGAALFVDANGGDFHLVSGSKAIDAGTASLSGKNAPTVDFEGGARPQGAGFDVGADESGAGAAGAGGSGGTSSGGSGGTSSGGSAGTSSGGSAGTSSGGSAGTSSGGSAGTSSGGSAGTSSGGSAGTSSGGSAGTSSGGSAGATGGKGGTSSGGSGGTSSGGSAGATAGKGGSAGTTGSAGKGGTTASTGGASGAAGSAGASDGAAADDASSSDDGGCGCRVPAPAAPRGGLLMALAALAGLAGLRRRRG